MIIKVPIYFEVESVLTEDIPLVTEELQAQLFKLSRKKKYKVVLLEDLPSNEVYIIETTLLSVDQAFESLRVRR